MLAIADGEYFKKINPAFPKVLGYSIDELLNRPFLAFVHPDDIAKTTAEIEKLKLGEETIYFENRYIARKGSIKWLAWTAYPDADTRLIFAIARDITEQKENQQYIQLLIDINPEPLLSIDCNGGIIDANNAACKAIGIQKDKLIGTKFIDYFYDKASAQKANEEVYRLGRIKNFPLTIRNQEGKMIDVYYNGSIYNVKGNIIIGILQRIILDTA